MSNIEAAEVAVGSDAERRDYGPAPSKAEASRAAQSRRGC